MGMVSVLKKNKGRCAAMGSLSEASVASSEVAAASLDDEGYPKYHWVGRFANHGAAAASVHKELETIRSAHGGFAPPEEIVDMARGPTSAMHAIFQWDDSKAAHEQRLAVARTLARSIRAVPYKEAPPQRVYVSVQIQRDGGQRAYTSIKSITEADHVTQLMVEALRDLRAFINRYRELELRLPSVLRVVERLAIVLEKELRRAAAEDCRKSDKNTKKP